LRGFRDADGQRWDVVVGRESWGTVVAIFLPRNGDQIPRQALLETTSAEEAARDLLDMPEGDLQRLLTISEPKTIG
jgi:hypothetical protein